MSHPPPRHLAVVVLEPRTRLDAAAIGARIDGGRLPETDADASLETVVVSTCARSELWVAGRRRLETDELRKLAGALITTDIVRDVVRDVVRDHDAVHRLLRTAAGLGSPLRGEGEILGQLRRAFARGTFLAEGSLLRGLGQRAIAVGREARRLPGLRIDYSAAVAALLPASARAVGVVGSGPFAARLSARLAARLATGRVVVLYSRHASRSTRVIEGEGAARRVVVRPPSRLADDLATLDALVTAARDGSTVLRRAQLATRFRPLRVVDLGVPPTVEPAVGEHPAVELSRLDDLHHAIDRPTLERAEELVRRRAEETVRWWRRRHRLAGRTLVLAAHGAGDGSDANRAVEALAKAVHERLGLPVETAFHRGTPGFESLAGRSDLLVLPLLTSRGYYHRRLVELADVADDDLLPPLGADPRTVATSLDALLERVAGAPRARLAVLVVGHGTPRHPRSGDATEQLAGSVRRALPGARVEAAFLDQEPRLAEVARRLVDDPKVATLAVVPFLLGGADHARRDLDAALDGPLRDTRITRIDLPPLLGLPRLPHLVVSLVVSPVVDRTVDRTTEDRDELPEQPELQADARRAA